jgi:putative membrane protein
MNGYHEHFIGMHYVWWIVWLMLTVPFFFLVTPVRRKTARRYREDPFGILQRRYAAGEITTDEYEERKSRIARDSSHPKFLPLSGDAPPHDVPV